MADFENGLPPSDIGITGSEISNINYDSKEFDHKTDNNDVYAISYQQQESSRDIALGINSISYQQKELSKEVNVGLNAISYQANKAEISSAIGIQAISFQVEKVEGNNTVLFYL